MQWSPNWVCPKMWLPGYNLQAFPNFADDPTVQNGPIDTPWKKNKIIIIKMLIKTIVYTVITTII